jgi:putative transposase
MLAQAEDLASQGRLQSDIARTLGVSVMTLHRWRKMNVQSTARPVAALVDETGQFEQEIGPRQRAPELQLENARLRRLVTDLLLDKMELQEGVQGQPQNRPGRTQRVV